MTERTCGSQPAGRRLLKWRHGHIGLLDQGAGAGVICLHATGSSSQQWRRLGERLERQERFRLVAPDLSGVGQTGRPCSLDQWLGREIELIEELVALAGAPIHLVGHSYGGFLAAKFALAHPSCIATLTLIEPAGGGRRPELARVLDRCLPTAERLAAFFDSADPPEGWNRLSVAQQHRLLTDADVCFGQIETVLEAPLEVEHCGAIAAPTLVLTGTKSSEQLVSRAEDIAECLPKGRLQRVVGAGHMLPITHADEVNDFVLRHLVFG